MVGERRETHRESRGRNKTVPFRFESLDIWHMARDYSRKVYCATR